jgi:hypothetical protein
VDDFNRLRNQFPAMVEKRARHLVKEVKHFRRVVQLLEQGDIHFWLNTVIESA